jgi:hypothetical protein
MGSFYEVFRGGRAAFLVAYGPGLFIVSNDGAGLARKCINPLRNPLSKATLTILRAYHCYAETPGQIGMVNLVAIFFPIQHDWKHIKYIEQRVAKNRQ